MAKEKFDVSKIPGKMCITKKVETAGDGGTTVGRLAARMASRDMIDELNLGPKGKSPEAKQAAIADMGPISKLNIVGTYDHHKELSLKRGTAHEMEHTTDKALARKIAMDHLKEFPNYYDERVGLPAMEKNLIRIGDEPKTKTTPGRNMAEQARNAGNVFETRNK